MAQYLLLYQQFSKTELVKKKKPEKEMPMKKMSTL